MMNDTQPYEVSEDVPGFQERFRKMVSLIGSQKEAANIAGLGREIIGKYAKGTAKPKFCTMVRLAAAAGVSLDWLAGRAEKLDPHEVDCQLLADVIETLEQVNIDLKLKLSPAEKGRLAPLLYRYFLMDDSEKSRSEFIKQLMVVA